MFLSMHNWMRAEPIEVTIRRLARYGYESIEIAGEPDKYDTKEVGALLRNQAVPESLTREGVHAQAMAPGRLR